MEKRILLVEDNAQFREDFAQALERALAAETLDVTFVEAITKEVPPPEQRSLADDTKEAVAHAVASVIAVVVASAIVRWIAGGSQA
jgi:CheY-like chemotaxis protein